MPAKDSSKAVEQTTTPEAERWSDMDKVLTTLNRVFSAFGTQLQDAAPKPFDGAARIAVDAFNDIVAGLKFRSLPSALKIAGKLIPPTEIELTWTDDTANVDGYRVKRCQGKYCENFVEIRQLSPSVRLFRDANLAPDTTFRYQLISFNFRGETPSNIVDVTTTANPPEK